MGGAGRRGPSLPSLSQRECPHIVNIQGDDPLPVFLPDNCEDEV